MKLNNGMNEKQLVESAAKENVKVYGLSEYYSFGKEKVPKIVLLAGVKSQILLGNYVGFRLFVL